MDDLKTSAGEVVTEVAKGVGSVVANIPKQVRGPKPAEVEPSKEEQRKIQILKRKLAIAAGKQAAVQKSQPQLAQKAQNFSLPQLSRPKLPPAAATKQWVEKKPGFGG